MLLRGPATRSEEFDLFAEWLCSVNVEQLRLFSRTVGKSKDPPYQTKSDPVTFENHQTLN